MCGTHHGEVCGCGYEGRMARGRRFERDHADRECFEPRHDHLESGRESGERAPGFRRRFRSRSERIDELTEYPRALEAEGVREHLDGVGPLGSAD